MSMDEAVGILNEHIAPYFAKISEGQLRMRFVPGNDFVVAPCGLYAQQYQERFGGGAVECRCEDGMVMTDGTPVPTAALLARH